MYIVLSLWRNFQTQFHLFFRDAVFTLFDLFFQPSLWRCPLALPFGSAQFGSVQAASGDFFYVQWPKRFTLTKVLDCVCVSECVSTDPQECCPPGLPGNRQKHRTVWQVCLNAAGRPALRDDGRTPSHHHQVVCAHWLLLGLFLQVLVFVIAQPRDGLKVEITQRANISSSQVNCLQTTSVDRKLRATENENTVSLRNKMGIYKRFFVFCYLLVMILITVYHLEISCKYKYTSCPP